MKNFKIYHALAAPVIALFAVGCSSPVAMQSTEYDDMYYSSSDRTEYVQPQAQAPQQQQYAATDGNQQAAAGDVTQDYYADEYYDGRTYRPQATWNTPNYAVVDPYWTTAHVRRMNRFNAFYDPFFYDPFMMYDPFFDPFMMHRGMRVNIGFTMAFGGGWNRWGNPYGMWGHPFGMYDPFWGRGGWGFHNNYYAGFYHGYNHGFYGNNRFISDRPVVVQPRQYGPRESRGGVPVTGSPERVAGRPVRSQEATVGEQQQAARPQNVDYARPGRTDRSGGTGELRNEQSRPTVGTREALPARPSRQQPGSQQPVQRATPAREGNAPALQPQPQPIQRQERVQPTQQPTQRQERVQPAQRQQQPSYQRSQPVQRSQPSYERSQPVRSEPSYSPSRSSGTSSPPARSNSSGGGGRPGRGGN